MIRCCRKGDESLQALKGVMEKAWKNDVIREMESAVSKAACAFLHLMWI